MHQALFLCNKVYIVRFLELQYSHMLNITLTIGALTHKIIVDVSILLLPMKAIYIRNIL